MTNTNQEKKQKMALQDYYRKLPYASFPKSEFVTQVQLACGVTMSTVRNWITGRSKPRLESHVEKISLLTGIAKEDLWKD